ncbi:MAG TPA: V-type ATP synthase subunit B [Actinomycetota bacterium]
MFSAEYRTLSYASGPLLFVERVAGVGYGETVEVVSPSGERRRGQVLEVDGDRAVIQVFGGTRELDLRRTSVRFEGDVFRIGVGLDLLGRVLDGSGNPIDGGPRPVSEARRDVNGLPINPASRASPAEFVQTGISAIDGLNTLVRGQKLPIFSGFGLPANDLAAQIAASVAGMQEGAAVVLAALGITHREVDFFRTSFEESGALGRTILFLNLADDPAVERLLTPRAALTAAEYLAFDAGIDVLVIVTDMTNYCEALREVSTAREEIPGRRGYPGYMYTDLASIYERAGRIRGRPGSVTQLILLSMTDDDITHPIPDLTGYITEGQIVLSRDLHRRGVYPPIDVLPSLSRLMNAGIGPGKTREDHRRVADRLYAFYAQGQDVRRLMAIIGEAALSETDRRYLGFAEAFERTFLHQERGRTVAETLDLAWGLLARFPESELRIERELVDRYAPRSPSPD